eukprot:SAG31_NODE_22159_length_532_cov_1.120092_1_plen_32_part_01
MIARTAAAAAGMDGDGRAERVALASALHSSTS